MLHPLLSQPLHSPVQPLPWLWPGCWLKREDLLGGHALPGPKLRKLAGVLPWLQQQGIQQAVAIGGAHSNNLAALAQVLPASGIQATYLLRQAARTETAGNALLLHLLTTAQQRQYIAREAWPAVNETAAALAAQLTASGTPAAVLPEGLAMPQAVASTASLWADMLRNEAEHGLHIRHYWLSAGTGYMAAAVLAAAGAALAERGAVLHVVLLAQTPEEFAGVVASCCRTLGVPPPAPRTWQAHRPVSGGSFGSVNAAVLNFIADMASHTGILTDPVYTAKLCMTARHVTATEGLQGEAMLVHCGGSQALHGFGGKWL